MGGSTIDITGMTGAITIDSDTQNAYDGATNLNNNITVIGDFPGASYRRNRRFFRRHYRRQDHAEVVDTMKPYSFSRPLRRNSRRRALAPCPTQSAAM